MQKANRLSLEEVVQQVEDDEFEYFFEGSDEEFDFSDDELDDNDDIDSNSSDDVSLQHKFTYCLV